MHRLLHLSRSSQLHKDTAGEQLFCGRAVGYARILQAEDASASLSLSKIVLPRRGRLL